MLPIVLRILSTDELGMWFVFGSIAALVSLLDFGFSPSMMRNVIYAWSGAKKLYAEGTPEIDISLGTNYVLLRKLIIASKKIYLMIAVFAGVILLLVGTPYINSLIDSTQSSFIIAWIIYSIGVFFNLYTSFWNPFLKGIGAIKEANMALVFSKIVYMIFTTIGLHLGGGLVWLSVMYLLFGLVLRELSKYFFVRISKINEFKSEVNESIDAKEILRVIWPNARRLGVVMIGAWLINRSTTLLSSHFLGLSITAQYGLSIQLLTFVGGMSSLLFNSYVPEITSLKISGDRNRYNALFARSMITQWVMSITGILSVVFIVPYALDFIGSNSMLLPTSTLLLLGLVLFLEWNHSTFATLITLGNSVPFVNASLLSGVGIVITALLFAYNTEMGVLGLILAQGIVQLVYNNWYWPRYVLNESGLSIIDLIKIGMNDYFNILRKILGGKHE